MMDTTMTKPYTFNNMFLNELDTKTKNIQDSITKLYSDAKKYEVSQSTLCHILDSHEYLGDFRQLITDEDVLCCSDPDSAPPGGDPGDCAPGHEDNDTSKPKVEEVLCKLIRGVELGYLDIPVSLQSEIDECLLRL
jgi:hypothetical protein